MRHVFILALLGAAAYGATPMNGLKLGTDANGNGQSITNLNGITATGTVCSATITGAVHASTLTIAGKALGTAAALNVGGEAGEIPRWFEAPTNAAGLVFYSDDIPGGLMVGDHTVGSFATPASVWPLAQITNAGTAAALNTGAGSGEVPVWMAIATNWDSGWVYKINSGDDAAVRTMSMADAVGQGYAGSAATNATTDFVPDIESTAWAKVTTAAGATTYYTGPLAFSNAMRIVTNGGTVEYGGSHSWTGAVVRNGGVTNITIIGRPGSLLTAAIADTAGTDYALYLASIPGLRIDGMRLRGVLAAWTAGPTNDYFSYNAIFNSSIGVIENSTFQFEVTGDGTRGGFSPSAAIHKNVVALTADLLFDRCDFVTADTIASNNLAHTAFHWASAIELRDCRFLSYGCRRFTESTFRADKDAIIGCTANSDASLAGVRCVHPYSLTNALLASVTNAPDDNGIYQVGEDGAWLVDRKTATGEGATNWTTLVTVAVSTSAMASIWNQTLNADLYFEQTGGFGQMPLIYSIAYDGNVSTAYTGYLAGATAYSATRIRHLYSTSNICLQARSSTNIQPVRIRGYLRTSGINSVVGNETYTNSLHKTWRVTAP